MRLLVTGGLGFIGSNFVRYILNKYPDYEVINLDKMTYAANPDNLKDMEKFRRLISRSRYEFYKSDICNKGLVDKLIYDVDAVVNFAAESHVDRSISKSLDFIKTDILGTYTLLESARENNISKFVQIGTDESYGSIEEGSFKETDLLKPSSPYSASKASADMLVNAYFTTYRLPTVITRSSNNYGPYQYPEKLIPLFITKAIEDKELPLYGDGKNVRDWLYVLDNCEVIDLILHEGVNGEIYNVGGGNEITNVEITKKILKELNKPESLIKYVKDRPGHDRRYSVNCSKIKKLGWKPRYKFSKALKETVKWYKDNEWWWKKIKSGEFLKYYKEHYKR